MGFILIYSNYIDLYGIFIWDLYGIYIDLYGIYIDLQ